MQSPKRRHTNGESERDACGRAVGRELRAFEPAPRTPDQRMKTGGFHNVEDVLMQALEASPVTDAKPSAAARNLMGADLIAAMQSSPYREIEIAPARYRMPVRDVRF